MSIEAAKQFIQQAESDQTLRAKIEAIHFSGKEQRLADILQLSAAKGFRFTGPDYEAAFKERLLDRHAAGELSDEEMARIAGGMAARCCIRCGDH